MNAALAYSQLNRFDEISIRMHEILNFYKENLPGQYIERENGETPWLIEVKLNVKSQPPLRKLYNRIRNEISLTPFFAKFNEEKPNFTDWFFLPSTHTLTKGQLTLIVDEIKTYLV